MISTQMKTFNVVVFPGDGIGTEITPPALELVKEAAYTKGVRLNFEVLPAGAQHYLDTGVGLAQEHFESAAAADAIYLAAMGLPDIRYPDGTAVSYTHLTLPTTPYV